MAILLTVLLAVLLIGGGALVFYVSTLAKNAYEIKVSLQNDLEAGLKKIEDETVKNARWMKRDLIEDIDKSKQAIVMDNQRRAAEAAEAIDKRLRDFEAAARAREEEAASRIEGMAKDVQLLGRAVVALQRQVVLAAAPVPAEPAADPTAGISAQQATVD